MPNVVSFLPTHSPIVRYAAHRVIKRDIRDVKDRVCFPAKPIVRVDAGTVESIPSPDELRVAGLPRGSFVDYYSGWWVVSAGATRRVKDHASDGRLLFDPSDGKEWTGPLTGMQAVFAPVARVRVETPRRLVVLDDVDGVLGGGHLRFIEAEDMREHRIRSAGDDGIIYTETHVSEDAGATVLAAVRPRNFTKSAACGEAASGGTHVSNPGGDGSSFAWQADATDAVLRLVHTDASGSSFVVHEFERRAGA